MPNYITMSRLGGHGRFANSIFQYMFLRIYARLHNLSVQTAPWIGEYVFKIDPSPVTVQLPSYVEPLDEDTNPCGWPGTEVINHDFHGYGQHHMRHYQPHKRFIQELFQPTAALCDRLNPAVEKLDTLGETRVGIHLRRGDYGRLRFYITPVEWYLDWLAKFWPTLKNPVLFVASEDKSLVDEFADYNPQTTKSLGIDLYGKPMPTYHYLRYDLEHPEPHLLDFFPDWYLLTWCEYLLIPNSTFSFAAAMLPEWLRHCYRSDLPTQRFVEIDPWDVAPLTPEVAEDYRHIPGICLDSNPQW